MKRKIAYFAAALFVVILIFAAFAPLWYKQSEGPPVETPAGQTR